MSDLTREQIDELRRLHEAATPGDWILATSNSYRRYICERDGHVCEPVTQHDGHPDLHFPNGGQDGPDARLIPAMRNALPALLDAADERDRLRAENERLIREMQRIAGETLRGGDHGDG